MTSDAQRLREYLEHILLAIRRIEIYTKDTNKPDFVQNVMVQDAVIRNLEVIGEASHNIEQRFPDFTVVHPELPLAFAYQMRNAVAHGYFKVDLEIVWNTVESDLPRLRSQVEEIVRKLP
jgi:uncharacterized protein with HEPN domain